MRLGIISFALLSFLIFSPIVFAQGKTYQYCEDNTTLIKKTEITVDIPQRNITRTFNVTDPILCEFGCDNSTNPDQCFRATSTNWFIAIGLILGAIILISFIYAVAKT